MSSIFSKLAAAILVLLVLYFAAAYIRFKSVLSKAKLPEIVQADVTFGKDTAPGLRYIAAGDSTAKGEGASEVSKTYPRLIAEELAQTHYLQYRNIAVGGYKTTDVINDSLPKIIEFNPDVVTISVGANDLTHWKSSKGILENYRIIIDTLLEKTNAKVFITNIPNFHEADLLPLIYRKALDIKTQPLNREIEKLESDRVKIVPIYSFGWDQFPDLSVTHAADRFHPNDLGYTNWANAFLSRTKPVIK